MKPYFSLIVPIYNVEEYLDKCLASIASQTYRNFETLLIDDGSTDNSCIIAESFKDAIPNCRIIRQANSGLSGARNAALSFVNGDYIVFIDSDDWIESNYLECAYITLKNTKYDIIRIGWYEHRGDESIKKIDLIDEQADLTNVRSDILLDNLGAQVWKNIYKSSIWEDIKFPDRLYEDLYVTHVIFNRAKSFKIIPKELYHYIIRGNSISNKYSCRKALDIYYAFLERVKFAQNKICTSKLQLLRGKTIIHGIQALHASTEYTEVSKIASQLLTMLKESCIDIPSIKKGEIKFAFLFPRIYSFICMVYRNMRSI